MFFKSIYFCEIVFNIKSKHSTACTFSDSDLFLFKLKLKYYTVTF